MLNSLSKPLLFSIIAALGGLLAALLGEVLLYLMNPQADIKHDVVLLLDTSGSMSGNKLKEVKIAATNFVDDRHLSANSSERLAVVEFGNRIRVVASLTHDVNLLKQALNGLSAGGGTPMAEGLEKALESLSDSNSNNHSRHILLFTDGQPDNPNTALSMSNSVRTANIQLVAVATKDADGQFLSQMTGDANKVFFADIGKFKLAFEKAEKVIFNTPLNIQGSNKSSLFLALEVAIWTAILAIGISLFLIMGQNFYLHRPLFSGKELVMGLGGGALAGILSGVVGQLLYSGLISTLIDKNAIPSDQIRILVESIRVLAWIVLGMLLGLGMSLFIPNLKKVRASLGGGLGGLIGVIGFLLLTYLLGDTSGRILGATIIGFFIGLMIALVELAKEAWLEVHWGPQDKSIIVLGKTPITIGSSKTAHIYLPEKTGAPGEIGVVTWQKGTIEFHNKLTNQTQKLRNGSKWKIGEIEIEVKTHK